MSVLITRASVWEDSGAFVMAHVTGNAGTAITQASISSITAKVFDLADNSVVLNIGAVATTNISDTLVTTATDPRWTVATSVAAGYNFSYALPATSFPTGGNRYRVEFIFTPSSGAVFPLVFELDASPLLTS